MSNSQNDILSVKGFLSIVIFVLLIQITSLFLTSKFIGLYQFLPSYQPAGNTTTGSILNSVILILFTFFITIIILFLLRSKRFLLLKFMFIFALSVGTFSVSYIIFIVVFNSLFSNSFIIVFSLFLSLITILSMTILKLNVFQLITSFILASLYGTSLAIFLKPPTIIIIPIVFAIYDIYAVFYGPLKSIINSSDDSFDMRPLLVNLENFNIGTGDLIFYSMIPSSVLLLINLPTAIFSIILIHVGIFLTILFLKRFEFFPGLPIPVLFSIIPFLLFY